jgi:hypothetical protein
MTNDEVFEVWAPLGSAWAPWCKPVLFAHIDGDEPPPEPEPLDNVDLPGRSSVAVGLLLAEKIGYRPVPLFNAAPAPREGQETVVDVSSTLAALFHGTNTLKRISIEADAPPIFLLDANRRGESPVVDDEFDNRSVSFPTDFPSATRLLSSGIRRALLIQTRRGALRPDLAHTLRRWQEAGIPIAEKALRDDDASRPIDVSKPSSFKSALYRMLEMVGLQRNVLGGFGGFPPGPGGWFGAGG